MPIGVVYNAISNGGNSPYQWRTLTKNEWIFVFNTRSTPSGIRYAKAVVKGVKGIILLPDDWSTSMYALNYTNRGDAPFTTNEITVESWATLETSGAVFLPVTSSRNGTEIHIDFGGPASGHYWSASYGNYYGGCGARIVYFDNSELDTNFDYTRNTGRSVRLVRDVE